MAIRTRQDFYGFTTNIKTERLYPLSRMVSSITGLVVQRNKAIVGRNAFAHESGIHADGALKDRGNYELYDDSVLGPFPADWYTREGRVVLTGEYGGKAGFRHVLDGLGIAVADGAEDLVFSLVQLCASATGKPLTDDELRVIAGYPQQLALLFGGQLG